MSLWGRLLGWAFRRPDPLKAPPGCRCHPLWHEIHFDRDAGVAMIMLVSRMDERWAESVRSNFKRYPVCFYLGREAHKTEHGVSYCGRTWPVAHVMSCNCGGGLNAAREAVPAMGRVTCGGYGTQSIQPALDKIASAIGVVEVRGPKGELMEFILGPGLDKPTEKRRS